MNWLGIGLHIPHPVNACLCIAVAFNLSYRGEEKKKRKKKEEGNLTLLPVWRKFESFFVIETGKGFFFSSLQQVWLIEFPPNEGIKKRGKNSTRGKKSRRISTSFYPFIFFFTPHFYFCIDFISCHLAINIYSFFLLFPFTQSVL